jgi:hypothetical protein
MAEDLSCKNIPTAVADHEMFLLLWKATLYYRIQKGLALAHCMSSLKPEYPQPYFFLISVIIVSSSSRSQN